MTARQLALPFGHDPGYRAADVCAAPSNREALAWLSRTGEWPGGRLALWGGEGCGKTHLLHAWAERQGFEVVDGARLRGVPPPRGLAVDDAEAAPEEPLLHLLNACAEAGAPVLLAAREPPARWGTRLPDLASRLRATVAVEIRPAEEALLRTLLTRLLSERQLTVSPPLRDWLLARLPRSAGSLREAAARLDRAALAEGGRVTRPLAARVVAELAEREGVDPGSPEDGPGLRQDVTFPLAPRLF